MTGATRTIALALLGAVLAFPFVFGAAMENGITHDEYQHIAAGALLARHGSLPYRDFPYFHTPHLAFVYAGLFRLSDHLLIAARVFSEICTALTAGILFAVAWRTFQEWRPGARLAGSLAAVALFLTTPVLFEATGHAWNQQPSVLFAVFSTVLVLAAPQMRRTSLALFGAGLCLGLSVGFRITFAPLALPLLCIICFAPQLSARLRVPLLAWFSAGAALGLAPLWWLFIVAPEQTFFGNFEFAKVNIIYRFATGEPRTMTLAKKLRFMVKEFAAPNWVLIAGLATALFWYLRFSRRQAERFPLLALAALFPFLLAGALAPSPVFIQYFYALVPFIILAMIFTVSPLTEWKTPARIAAATLAALVLLSAGLATNEYRDNLKDLLRPDDWKAMHLHREAQALRAVPGNGPVLTLGPTESLEAGLDIYPAFSTGPFAFRVAPFIERSKRQRLGIVAPEDLPTYLERQPPRAIVLGYEHEFEDPLEEIAKNRGFREHGIGTKRRVWLPQ